MTPEQQQRIEQIRERRKAISPAPWQHMGPTSNEVQRGEMRQYVTRTVGCGDVPPEKFFITILNCGNDVARDVADAEFIAAAPDDIDFLLSLVEEQEAQPNLLRLLTICESAIRSLPQDSLGQDKEIGYFYRDELLLKLESTRKGDVPMNRFVFSSDTTDAAPLNASCPRCGGSKPTCCSCPLPAIAERAQEVVDRWLVDRRLLDQAFITTQDREALAEQVTQLTANTAESMRSLCVERVKSTRQRYHDDAETADNANDNINMLILLHKASAASEIIKELESLSIQS